MEFLSRLSLGQRVAIGFGFWTVGLSALAGTAMTIGDNVHTKFDHYAAEKQRDDAQVQLLEGRLADQKHQVWVFVATGAASLAMGLRLTRDIEQLWSGELAGAPTTESTTEPNVAPVVDQPEPLPTFTASTTTIDSPLHHIA